jgi:hypothetical protein
MTDKSVKEAADRAEARAKGESGPKDFEFKAGDEDVSNWPEQKRNGDPIKGSMMNAREAIRRLKLTCRQDTFLDQRLVSGDGLNGFSGELSDELVRKVRELSFQKEEYEPGKEAMQEALLRACEENKFDSLRDQLDSLVWDRKPRLDKWLTTYLGVEDTELTRAQGALVLMAAVRRVYQPGCKFDHVLVLEGPEGAIKSGAIKVLASGGFTEGRIPYFSESPILHKRERDQQENLKGVWFYELAEMAGMKKADQYMVKNFITKTEERARAAYDRFLKSTVRVPIFIGTFNTDANNDQLVEYLNPGDRRRWWSVKVGKIKIDDLIRDHWQLFAEAKERVQPEPRKWIELYLPPKLEALARGEAAKREITSPISDRLSTLFSELLAKPNSVGNVPVVEGRDYIVGKKEVWVSSNLVVQLVGRLDPSGRNTAGALSAIGWSRTNDTRGGRLPVSMRGYVHVRATGDKPRKPDQQVEASADFAEAEECPDFSQPMA